jgi:hypothetical protein
MALLALTLCNSNTALSDDDLAALCTGLVQLEALDTRQCFLLTEHALELAAALTSLTACMCNQWLCAGPWSDVKKLRMAALSAPHVCGNHRLNPDEIGIWVLLETQSSTK